MDILENENLSRHCNYGCGGNTKYFAMPYDDRELGEILLWAADKNVNYEVIGGGSNLLISDDGYDGLIISTANLNKNILLYGEKVFAGAGVKFIELIIYSINEGLGGLEKLAGIPGCIGGAIKMNAGAFDTEIKDVAEWISVMDKTGKSFKISAKDALFEYRKSKGLDGFIITGGQFDLKKMDKNVLENTKIEILKKRKEKQPLDKPSCGSVFKRPVGGYAGTLIQECGLKGLRKGGAIISEKHANFILNDNNAKSADIKFLIDTIVETVSLKKGITLEPEVKMIGF